MSPVRVRGLHRRLIPTVYTVAALAAALGAPVRPLLATVPVALASPSALQDGEFLRVRVDEARNRLMLEVPAAQVGRDFLYTNTLATGLGTGSLDRGQTGASFIVRLERRGNRLLMVRDNWSVRAPGADEAGLRAAKDAFPRSVSASFTIESETNGVITVDATSFFLSDVYGVAGGLRGGQGGGNYRVDAARSWFDTDRTKSFPRNAEVHSVLTFTSDAPAATARRAAPDAGAMVFEQHHSLIVLPDTTGFRPRDYDGRSGYGGTQFADLSLGFDQQYRGGFINRWRLVPKDPAAYARGELVEPVTPIIYYLDPGIPAPYREAFREGGNWWAKVFEAAGFRNAFQVRDLPAGADPMDARYNMLMWVHRNGPGPSVGPSYSDPRTGEIVRAVVRMDAWRSLVDYNIWAGTVPASGPNGPNVSAEAFTMSRRRQHTAHEIGHTLGLSHNYIAATQGRSSVMDYPVPLITVGGDGRPDLRDAYRTGPGAWDSLAIRFGYRWYPNEAAERAGNAAVIKEMIDRNVRFINDTYAGANGSIPDVTRWVEGATMFDAVERTSRVRRLLMDNFDERAIQPGEPMHLLNMRFAHVYLHHRYSLEGLVKYVGGMDFRFAMRGDGQVPTTVIPSSQQRRALGMALDALNPAELAVPARISAMIPPAPPGMGGDMTWIPGNAGTAFDPITLAGGLATEVMGYLLDRERVARLVIFKAQDPGALGFDEVLDTLMARTWRSSASTRYPAIQRAVERSALDALLDLAGDVRAMPEVRAIASMHLQQLDEYLEDALDDATGTRDAAYAHKLAARVDIERFLDGEDVPASRSRFPVLPLPWP
jgi:hypothetical protein